MMQAQTNKNETKTGREFAKQMITKRTAYTDATLF